MGIPRRLSQQLVRVKSSRGWLLALFLLPHLALSQESGRGTLEVSLQLKEGSSFPVVAQVSRGGAGDLAGVRVGDFVQRIGDQELQGMDMLELLRTVASLKAGDDVAVHLLRGKEALRLVARPQPISPEREALLLEFLQHQEERAAAGLPCDRCGSHKPNFMELIPRWSKHGDRVLVTVTRLQRGYLVKAKDQIDRMMNSEEFPEPLQGLLGDLSVGDHVVLAVQSDGRQTSVDLAEEPSSP